MFQTVICPQCRQIDSVRKVSAIVDEGTSVIHSSGVAPIQTKDGTYWVPVQKEGVSRTKLSQKLAFSSPNIDRFLDAIGPSPEGGGCELIFIIYFISCYWLCSLLPHWEWTHRPSGLSVQLRNVSLGNWPLLSRR